MQPVNLPVLCCHQRHQFSKAGWVVGRETVQGRLGCTDAWVAWFNLVDWGATDLGDVLEALGGCGDVFTQHSLARIPGRVSLLQGAQGLHLLVRSSGAGVACLGLAPQAVSGLDEVLAGSELAQLHCCGLTNGLGLDVDVLLLLDVALAKGV